MVCGDMPQSYVGTIQPHLGKSLLWSVNMGTQSFWCLPSLLRGSLSPGGNFAATFLRHKTSFLFVSCPSHAEMDKAISQNISAVHTNNCPAWISNRRHNA